MAKNSSEETIIAQGVRVEGDFVSQGDVYVEGEVNGNVKSSGDLRLGSHSMIQADVTANNAVVSGQVQGNVHINGRLDLLETAVVSGDIECEVLTIAAGAVMNGRVSMQSAKTPQAQKKEEAAE